MKTKLLKTAFVLAGLCGAAAAQAQANSYQLFYLGAGLADGINDRGQVVGQSQFGTSIWNNGVESLLPGGTANGVAAINDAGTAVGWVSLVTAPYVAAVQWNGTTQVQLPSGAQGGMANGINASGQVVGDYNGMAGIWTKGVPSTLSVTGYSSPGTFTGANAINNAGLAVGYAQNGTSQAVSWNTGSGGSGTILQSLGGHSALALAVNNSGLIVGDATNAAGTQFATEWNGTTITQLQSLSSRASIANSVNDAGLIVGQSQDAGGAVFATLWKGTSIVNLNSLLSPAQRQEGWVLTDATGINQNGWIVGDMVNSKENLSGVFELRPINPVPEANTWAMLLAGLGLIGGWARRRRV